MKKSQALDILHANSKIVLPDCLHNMKEQLVSKITRQKDGDVDDETGKEVLFFQAELAFIESYEKPQLLANSLQNLLHAGVVCTAAIKDKLKALLKLISEGVTADQITTVMIAAYRRKPMLSENTIEKIFSFRQQELNELISLVKVLGDYLVSYKDSQGIYHFSCLCGDENLAEIFKVTSKQWGLLFKKINAASNRCCLDQDLLRRLIQEGPELPQSAPALLANLSMWSGSINTPGSPPPPYLTFD